MAHKKGQGSTRNGRDSNPKYRGIKLYGGETAEPGCILVRQVGTPFKAGYLVRMGRDNTLFAVGRGRVIYHGRKVHIDPTEAGVPRPAWLPAAKSA
jgi:large subunit ribosomal protein L27